MRRLFNSTALALLVLLGSTVSAQAVSQPSMAAQQAAGAKIATPQDQPNKVIVISPYLSETRLLSTDTSKDVSISLTNNTADTQSFSVSTLDFGALNDTGGLVFAGADASSLVHKYGLAHWLHLAQDHQTLAAGETTKLVATIDNQADLGPGGHYAAIVMTVEGASGDSSGTVSVQQKISALIFATKVGGEVYDLKLNKIQHDGSWQQLPNLITLTFKNTGNVHVVPRGTVKLIAPSGHIVSQGIINEASAYVLPETSRQLIVQPQAVSNRGWEAGTYKLQVDYRYDGYTSFASKAVALRYYNIRGMLLAVVAVIVLLFAAYKLGPRRKLFSDRFKVSKNSTSDDANHDE